VDRGDRHPRGTCGLASRRGTAPVDEEPVPEVPQLEVALVHTPILTFGKRATFHEAAVEAVMLQQPLQNQGGGQGRRLADTDG
jgi:hypothetical protein